jgi:protein-S-isoprenylcysteine O-methyltransferase Ste14
VLYEEPALRTTFGSSYITYSDRVHRWWPRRRAE